MLSFRHLATYISPEIRFVTNLTDLQAAYVGGGYTLFSATHVGGGVASYRITSADAAISLTTSRDYTGIQSYLDTPATTVIDTARGAEFYVTGVRNSLHTGGALDASGAFTTSGLTGLGQMGPEIIHFGQFQTGQGQFLYSARNGVSGFDTWRVAADGSIVQVARANLPTGAVGQGSEISDMQAVSVGDRTYIVTSSALGNYVSVQGINRDGTLGGNQILSSARGLGLNEPTHVEVVTMMGVSYLIVGSSQSSSLTTMRLTYSGMLEPIDHVIDEMTTRFRGVSAMETVMMNGRAFIFVGGGDDGISMFTLTPDGRLLHLASIADSDGQSLAKVSSISAVVMGDKIALFVSSATEAGITQFVVEPGAIGYTSVAGAGRINGTANADMLRAGSATRSINGGAGDDILISGNLPVELTGGEGADLFVVTPINGRVTITDYELGVDRLDLSNLGMIRSTMQLVFSPQSDGIKIFFGNSVIIIRTKDGMGLQAGSFDNSMFPVAHYSPPDMRTTVIGTPKDDTLVAGRFGSTIQAGEGNDVIVGSDAADQIYAGSGNDTVSGGGGNDQIWGREGNDVIRAGSGNDTVFGDSGDDRIWGGSGNDVLSGDAGNDVIFGEDGDDRITDLLGKSVIWGGTGNDTVTTGASNDRVYAGDGNDWVRGGGGDDLLAGGAGNDSLWGEPGDDQLYGGTGDDQLYGGLGNDRIFGETGNDLLRGEAGNDTIDGGAGFDTIIGGTGSDRMAGGANADTFRFVDRGDFDRSTDYIMDFASGSDVIDMRGLGLTFANGIRQPGQPVLSIDHRSATQSVVSVDLQSDGITDLTIVISGSRASESDFLL